MSNLASKVSYLISALWWSLSSYCRVQKSCKDKMAMQNGNAKGNTEAFGAPALVQPLTPHTRLLRLRKGAFHNPRHVCIAGVKALEQMMRRQLTQRGACAYGQMVKTIKGLKPTTAFLLWLGMQFWNYLEEGEKIQVISDF
ncbi:uncharacterized protein J5F26_007148 isoform 1-T4 [Ciconia maguari]